jgi:MarR family transcriptional regulator, lower aerobic nicotinate degradation pathway regulator
MDSSADVRVAMDALRRIVRELRLTARAAERAVGLSGAQLFVLERLQETPGMSLRALAARTATDESSVSVVVGRLVARGLVLRRRAADDGRRAELSLSASGRGLLERGPRPAQVRLVAALAALPAARRRSLATGLALVARRLDADDGPPAMFFEDDRPAGRHRARSARGR